MADSYFTVYREGEGEVTEKKSRFIANVYPADTEEEALSFVEKIRKKHYDARHHCFAYIIGSGGEKKRASDDGEPQGTAGKPILEVMEGAGLCNAVVIVTRYFGGTLLGTGGLVRAYSMAAREGIEASVIIEKKTGQLAEILADYTEVGKMQYLFGERKLPVIDTQYTDKVLFTVIVPDEDVGALRKKLMELTSGREDLSDTVRVYYADAEGEIIYDLAD